MRNQKPKNRNSEVIGLLKEGLGKIDRLTEMAKSEGVRAQRLLVDAREIKNLVSGLQADGRSKVYLKGTKRKQFFEAVEAQEANPRLSPWKCAIVACSKIEPTAENGGFDADNLYRYIRTKPEYFRWKRGKNALKYPMA